MLAPMPTPDCAIVIALHDSAAESGALPFTFRCLEFRKERAPDEDAI